MPDNLGRATIEDRLDGIERVLEMILSRPEWDPKAATLTVEARELLNEWWLYRYDVHNVYPLLRSPDNMGPS